MNDNLPPRGRTAIPPFLGDDEMRKEYKLTAGEFELLHRSMLESKHEEDPIYLEAWNQICANHHCNSETVEGSEKGDLYFTAIPL